MGSHFETVQYVSFTYGLNQCPTKELNLYIFNDRLLYTESKLVPTKRLVFKRLETQKSAEI